MSPNSEQPARDADTSNTNEQLLSAIDAVLKHCALTQKLACQLTPETACTCAEGQSPAHHPDAAIVLRLCRQRHPDWTEFSEQTVKVVLVRLLHDRESMALLGRICNESPQTIARVMDRLRALSPDGEDDDAWWVWHELARRYPDTLDYDYSTRQIVSAWKMVRSMRRRQDHIGLGGPRPEARRQRRLALARFAAELAWPRSRLLQLDIDDYDPFEGTLAFVYAGCRSLARLSTSAQRAADKWLRWRGRGRGGLFELPELPEFWEVTASARACLDAPADDGASGCASVETEDCVEALCRGLDPLACAFVLGNLADKGGDWSAEFVERLTAACGAATEHALTRHERRQCRRHLRQRLSAAATSAGANA